MYFDLFDLKPMIFFLCIYKPFKIIYIIIHDNRIPTYIILLNIIFQPFNKSGITHTNLAGLSLKIKYAKNSN